MKRKIIVLLASVLIAVPVCSFAAAWYVPSNVRVVQKSNTDTSGRIYSTITAALDSITTPPTATTPVVIKVMPGVYDLGTTAIQMKPYVTLEGSGAENTIITATSTETEGCDNQTGMIGTIRMANNSTVKNLTIKTTAVNGHATGIAVVNVKGMVDGVKVVTTGTTGADGICLTGPGMDSLADIEVSNAIIEATTSWSQANAVLANGGVSKLTATKSRFTAFNNGGTGDVINFETAGGFVTISDSIVEAAGTTPAVNYIINSNEGTMTVTNSKILGSCKFNYTYAPNSLKIANSLIELGKTPDCDWSNPSLRLVNNFDENFNAIPNR